jgi:cysteinyl-tRNA synthetase
MDKAQIEELIAKRDEARAKKDYQEADRIRKELSASGVEILDTPEGTQWRSAN